MYRTLYLTVYSHPYREYRTLYLTFYSHLYKEYRTLYLTFYSHPFKEYRTFTPIHIKSIELFPLQFTSRFNAKKVISEMCAFLYCSVLSLGGNVNTRRIWKPNMGFIFQIKNHWNILVIGDYYANYQNYPNLMFLTSSYPKRTLKHLFLFTNSAQRELISICAQSMRNYN